MLDHLHAALPEFEGDARRHLEPSRRDRVQRDAIEREGECQRVRGPPVAQVPEQPDIDPINRHRLPDRVEVEQRLARVLPRAVASVDDRHRGELTCQPCRPFLWVAEHDGVRVAAQHPDGVGQCLSLDDRTCLDRIDADPPSAEPRHGRRKRHPCAGAGLKEEKSRKFILKHPGLVAPGIKLLRPIEQVIKIAALKITDRNNVVHCVATFRRSGPGQACGRPNLPASPP